MSDSKSISYRDLSKIVKETIETISEMPSDVLDPGQTTIDSPMSRPFASYAVPKSNQDTCPDGVIKAAEELGFSELEKKLVCNDYPAKLDPKESAVWRFSKEMGKEMGKDLATGTLMHSLLGIGPGGLSSSLSKLDIGGKMGSIFNVGYAIRRLISIGDKASWVGGEEHGKLIKQIKRVHSAMIKDVSNMLPDTDKGGPIYAKGLDLIFKFNPRFEVQVSDEKELKFRDITSFSRKVKEHVKKEKLRLPNFSKKFVEIIKIMRKDFPLLSDSDFKGNLDAYAENRFVKGRRDWLGEYDSNYEQNKQSGALGKVPSLEIIFEKEIIKFFKVYDNSTGDASSLSSFLSLLIRNVEESASDKFINKSDAPKFLKRIFNYRTMLSSLRREIVEKSLATETGEIANDLAMLAAEVYIFSRLKFLQSLGASVLMGTGTLVDAMPGLVKDYKKLNIEIQWCLRYARGLIESSKDKSVKSIDFDEDYVERSKYIEEKIVEFSSIITLNIASVGKLENELMSNKNIQDEKLLKYRKFIKKMKSDMQKIESEINQISTKRKDIQETSLHSVFKLINNAQKEDRSSLIVKNELSLDTAIKDYENFRDVLELEKYKSVSTRVADATLLNKVRDYFIGLFKEQSKPEAWKKRSRIQEKDNNNMIKEISLNPNNEQTALNRALGGKLIFPWSNWDSGPGVAFSRIVSENNIRSVKYSKIKSIFSLDNFNIKDHKKDVDYISNKIKKENVLRNLKYIAMANNVSKLSTGIKKIIMQSVGPLVIIQNTKFMDPDMPGQAPIFVASNIQGSTVQALQFASNNEAAAIATNLMKSLKWGTIGKGNPPDLGARLLQDGLLGRLEEEITKLDLLSSAVKNTKDIEDLGGEKEMFFSVFNNYYAAVYGLIKEIKNYDGNASAQNLYKIAAYSHTLRRVLEDQTI